MINPFLNLTILTNHDKVNGLSAMQWCNPYKGYCFSIVESLMCDLSLNQKGRNICTMNNILESYPDITNRREFIIE